MVQQLKQFGIVDAQQRLKHRLTEKLCRVVNLFSDLQLLSCEEVDRLPCRRVDIENILVRVGHY